MSAHISLFKRIKNSGPVLGLSLFALSCVVSCKVQTLSEPMGDVPASRFQGTVHGGQQPIAGATIQIYAAGSGGDGLSATPLLTKPVTTDQAGGFNVTGDYTCPGPSASMYIVASGGNPGLGAGTNNSASTLMTALGRCDGLTPSTFISINELTTVAATSALQPFMIGVASLSSSSADAASLTTAFTIADELVSSATGYAPGSNVPQGVTVPVLQLDTLANAVSRCINSSGGIAGDGSPCGNFFALTTLAGGIAPTDTVGALLTLAANPGLQTNALFNMVSPSAPFQPQLTTAPSDFVIRLGFRSALSVSPSFLSFPATYAGYPSASQTLTITNTSSAPAALAGLSLVGPDASEFSTGSPCPPTLATGASCTVPLVFTPLASGSRGASFLLTNSSTGQQLAVPLAGLGSSSVAPTTFSQSLNNSTVFMGASIVAYWPLPAHNLGIPGQVTSDMLSRFSAQVLGHGYSGVVILGGTNDIINGLPNLPGELTANLQAMAEMATKAGMEVVLSELPPITSNGVNMNATVVQVDAAIKELALEHGYLVVDYYTPMAGHPEYFSDGVHPVASGYAVMEQALAGVVSR